MCRIAGIVRPDPGNLKADIRRMRDAMRHGGPDDAGIYLDEAIPLALGHRRLAIIDLTEAGHQPMIDAERELVLVYNGELYNFLELREELQALGYIFRTRTDTEVVLKSYAAWGTGCFQRFNGMFALALYDKQQHSLVLARDHAGIKPLYYSVTGDRLYFASEIRAFRALYTGWPENPDWRVFFLSFGHLPEPVTTLRGVQSLPKCHYFLYDLEKHSGTLHRYTRWEIRPEIEPESQTRNRLRQVLTQAVHHQLVSDAPIGLFLSGGTDSSILALAATAKAGISLQTTSIVFEEAGFSEKEYQDIIIRATGVKHQFVTLRRADFDTALDDVLIAMDQPSNDGINSYFISRAARAAGLTVALSGIGADELFGGYPSFNYAQHVPRLRRLPLPALRALANTGGDRWKKVKFLALPGAIGEYLFYRGLFAPSDVARLCGFSEKTITENLLALPADPQYNELDDDNRVSWIEVNYYMQNQLLKDTDAMSMWHSLEVRVPFLDRLVFDLAGRISPARKFGRTRKKQLLTDAFSPELPRAIWDRPKKGFTFPFNDWLRASEHLHTSEKNLLPYLNRFQRGDLSWARMWVAYLALTL